MSTNNRYTFKNITTNTTTLVYTGPCVLGAIICNKGVASGVITLYDGISAGGTKIGTITEPGTLLASQWRMEYNIALSVGLTIVTSAAEDLTIAWCPS